MVLLQQTGQGSNDPELSSHPRSRDVVIQINSKNVAMPASATCDNGDVLVPIMVAAPYQELRSRVGGRVDAEGMVHSGHYGIVIPTVVEGPAVSPTSCGFWLVI